MDYDETTPTNDPRYYNQWGQDVREIGAAFQRRQEKKRHEREEARNRHRIIEPR